MTSNTRDKPKNPVFLHTGTIYSKVEFFKNLHPDRSFSKAQLSVTQKSGQEKATFGMWVEGLDFHSSTFIPLEWAYVLLLLFLEQQLAGIYSNSKFSKSDYFWM